MRNTKCVALSFVLLLGARAFSSAAVPPGKLIHEVTVSPPFFNPMLGESARVAFKAERAGRVTLQVLDRDRFPVRTLPARSVKAGGVALAFDGRDDEGAVLPDEAYSIRLEFTDGTAREVFDPSKDFVPVLEEPKTRSYSAYAGILSYQLSRPSRVHIQAGQASLNPKTGRTDGPVLKTVLDRLPRPEGSVVEHWGGYDESETVLVSVLPHFATSIVGSSLPDCSVLLVGNRKQTFVDYARLHRPQEALLPRPYAETGAHHAGLNAFEDRTPGLSIEAQGHRDAERRLVVDGSTLSLTVSVEPEAGKFFFSRPTEVQVFLDEERVFSNEKPDNPARVSVDTSKLPPGEHRLAVNWLSRSGPVGVQSLRLVVPERVAEKGKS